ncbi:MAG: LPXTG cell wall anchor domain-containing protein [Enterococcus sp.]|uniref:lectin-like domain-containing protein n=1 Tax=Enterococcus sp. TaxID=35783 RepID=UPI002647B8D6|nr:SpaA isopeptide-forming pilin-related protein [Enterococcus sp.]MDN6002111.1 LPXTG cell wall anchor domain-containing protein [Enterococcus sp.]MDN6217816.1 LPXTG cell wall anchor domain-containing protein [Enterococcus sp.]MDN6516732.1 LPXTG cell wall anchor domain-containing protein [Enterococcus sp.]MDN6560369.1 LPXTG cell wall anchor domain-containing protein [Enterococcus sp.]MDN6584767.1 LPXTG cell wall anchor domain-containing protein [Enterococcus sp.]
MNKEKRKSGNRAGLILLFLFLPCMNYLFAGKTVFADETTHQEQQFSLFDLAQGKGELSYKATNDKISWTVSLNQFSTETDSQFQLEVESDGQPLEATSIKSIAGDERYLFDPQSHTIREQNFSSAQRTNQFSFETKRVSQVALFPSVLTTNPKKGEPSDLLKNSPPIQLKIAGTEDLDTSEPTTTTSSSTGGQSVSKETQKATTDSEKTDQTDLHEADEKTVDSVKKEAEKKFEATGAPQVITRSSAEAAYATSVIVTKDNFLNYFNLLGSAANGYDPTTGIVTLTPDKNGQVGNLTLKNKIDLNHDFVLDGLINLGSDPNGADGVSFGFHTGKTTDLGIPGGNLGIGGLENAIGFKLDTYRNGYQAPSANQFGWAADVANVSYPYGTFVTTSQKQIRGSDGKMYTRWWAEPDAGSAKSLGRTYMDGKFHPLNVSYSGAEKTLTITFDTTYKWTRKVDAKEALALVVSASTGGAKNLQQFKLNQFGFDPQGVINTRYVDRETGKELPYGEQFSGTITSEKSPLVNPTTNKTLLSQGYVYVGTTTDASEPQQYATAPYDPNTDPTHSSPTIDKGIFAEQPMTVTYYYSKFSGTATLVKKNNNGTPLAGAVFQLTDKNGTAVAGDDQLVTDGNGKIIVNGLKAGEYYFIEQKAPDGYALAPFSNQRYRVVISNDPKNQLNTTTVTNNLKPYDLTVMAVDADAPKETLAGFTFELKNSKGDIVAATDTSTGENGQLSFLNLSAGTYVLTETASKKDYVHSTQPLTLTIDGDGRVTVPGVSDLVTNKAGDTKNNQIYFSIKEKAKTVLPATGGSGTKGYYLIGVSGLLIYSSYFIYRRNRREAQDE